MARAKAQKREATTSRSASPPATRRPAAAKAEGTKKTTTTRKPRAKKEPGTSTRRSRKTAVVKHEEPEEEGQPEEEEPESKRKHRYTRSYSEKEEAVRRAAAAAAAATIAAEPTLEAKTAAEPPAEPQPKTEPDTEPDTPQSATSVKAETETEGATLRHIPHHAAGHMLPPPPLLPGIFAPAVDTRRAVRLVVAAALASSALSVAVHALVDWAAATPQLSWGAWVAYESTVAAPGVWSPVAALGIRLLKLAFAWGAFGHLVALDVLSYGPTIYLLASFYNVPLSAVAVSAVIDLAADVVPLAAWRWLTAADVDDEIEAKSEAHSEAEAGVEAADGSESDPLTFACSALFAAVLYGFSFVQACRFFLPGTFVVHFFGIATVEPARTLPLLSLSAEAPPSLYDAFVAIFLSVPALLLNLANGVAARAVIFSGAPAGGAPTYSAAVAVRTLALSLVVGADVFLQLFLGIQGVDAVGAGAYAAVWAAAPLLVGLGLGLTGV